MILKIILGKKENL